MDTDRESVAAQGAGDGVMHREICCTNTGRDCRRGGRGCCRACPYRKGGALHKTPAEQHEDLVRSWYHQVVIGASAIYDVPAASCGRALRSTVQKRIERRYRDAARRLSVTQKQTIERMCDAAPVDAAAAASCTTDDVWLWLLPSRTRSFVPFYALPLKLAA